MVNFFSGGKGKDDPGGSLVDKGKSALEKLKDVLSKAMEDAKGDIDLEPRITPIIDLSKAEDGSKDLANLLDPDLSLGDTDWDSMIEGGGGTSKIGKNGSKRAGEVYVEKDPLMPGEREQIKDNQGSGNINFTQNNYSPTALTRLDIYRQTRNQINTMKGLVRT